MWFRWTILINDLINLKSFRGAQLFWARAAPYNF